MFTEGLDESAINWIKQGTELDQQEPTPFRERFDLDFLAQPPVMYNRDYFTPTILPPLKSYSGFLGSHGNRSLGFEGDNESVVSVPDDSDMDCSDPFEDEGLGSSDSDLQEKPILRSCNEDLHTEKIDVKLNWKSVPGSDFIQDPSETKGFSKENLKTEILLNARRFTDGDLGIRGFVETRSVSSCEDQAEEQNLPDTYVHLADQDMPKKLPEAGTPSAPPIFDVGRDASGIELPSTTSNTPNETRASIHSKDGLADIGKTSQKTSDPCPSSILGDVGMQIPCKQANSIDQKAYYSISGQNSWQSIVAYDACIRLCLHAWARGCMEAPEFLQDECIVLRNSFGLQKFLLQPRAENPREGRIVDNIEETCMVKAKKSIGKIKVEVKKIRVIPRRKLHTTYSQWGGMYMQAGAEYVRHVSALLKSGINSLKTTSFSVTSQETLSCLLQLKSSSEGTQMELGSAISMQPGSGESHVFLSESQGDTLLLEVQDTKGTTQGRATIQISSLTDNPNDRIRWWPIYHEDQECMGKVQLAISSTNIAGEISSIKFGPVSETLAYDLALEAAMRTQNFHSRNLQLYGPWKWLLTEFADYYGVSDVYTKLRYLSCVMDMATPTKDCLELVHELLLPIVKARDENNLNRQERRMFSDCEFQVKRLLSTVFENYKSLDELAPTGLADSISSTSEVAAPALVPAVQVYTLLHDILAQEAQATLRNYLQTAAWKRCKRHVLETDEFTSNNNEGILMDPLTISTAYLKMKTLCMNISKEIETDIKIHNQHILPSSIDLPNIAAAVYSTELCNRLRGFLKACPPSGPLPYVTELLIATADFQRDLQSWNISPIVGGVDSKNLFHHYIMLWIQDKRLWLLELCKADKASWSGITQHTTSPFIEEMYDHIKETLNEYEVVINRWPQYALVLENAIADIERAIMKALEKQYSDILAPLKDSIPKMLGMQVQKFTRRHSVALYTVPNQLGTFLNTVKRILDILHCKVESVLKSWAFYLPGPGDRKAAFGEQLNGITVMLRTKYKNYMQATVEKLVSNTQANRGTRLKRIIEETKEAEGEAEIRERMQMLTSELTESICNLHDVFSGRIFVAICRGFWDRMGQGVLSFLASRKENRIWYKGSYYALGILDDTFASQMQRLQGNALQEKDLEPPRSVIEARSILCRDTQNTADSSTYFYF